MTWKTHNVQKSVETIQIIWRKTPFSFRVFHKRIHSGALPRLPRDFTTELSKTSTSSQFTNLNHCISFRSLLLSSFLAHWNHPKPSLWWKINLIYKCNLVGHRAPLLLTGLASLHSFVQITQYKHTASYTATIAALTTITTITVTINAKVFSDVCTTKWLS